MLSEERLELLAELHAPPVHPDYLSCDSWVEFARAIEREAYKAGQERMRERAAKECSKNIEIGDACKAIRNLEIEEPK